MAVSVLLGLSLMASAWMGLRTSERVARTIFVYRTSEMVRTALFAARHFPQADLDTLGRSLRDALPSSVQEFQVLSRDGKVLFSTIPTEKGRVLREVLPKLTGLTPSNSRVTDWKKDKDGTPLFEALKLLPMLPPPPLPRIPGPGGQFGPRPGDLPPDIEEFPPWCPEGLPCGEPVVLRIVIRAGEMPHFQALAQVEFVLSAGGGAILILLALLLYGAARKAAALSGELRNQAEMARLGQMSAVLAHEIRTPLSAIKGYAQLIAEGLPDGSGARRGAETIERESGRLERLAQSLLDVARPLRLVLRTANLNGIVENAASLAAGQAAAMEVRLLLDLAPRPVEVRVDPDVLVQAILNLVNNAVEASPARSAVTIGCGTGRGRAFCSVTDQGPGLDPKEADDVFKPFYTTRKGGAGLGLAVARRIAQEHGGDIEVERAAQGGCRFVLWVKSGG